MICLYGTGVYPPLDGRPLRLYAPSLVEFCLWITTLQDASAIPLEDLVLGVAQGNINVT